MNRVSNLEPNPMKLTNPSHQILKYLDCSVGSIDGGLPVKGIDKIGWSGGCAVRELDKFDMFENFISSCKTLPYSRRSQPILLHFL